MKTDARVRYTRMRIQEAFYDCLAHKPVSRITVKELCEAAEINRATFYKHYADPFDLLQKQEEEMLAQLQEQLDQRDGLDMAQLMATIWGDAGRNGQSRYALLSSPNGDPAFLTRISELFYRRFRPSMGRSLTGRTQDEQTAAYLFLAGGCGNLLSRWTEHGQTAPIEQVIATIDEMCEAFVSAYGKSGD